MAALHLGTNRTSAAYGYDGASRLQTATDNLSTAYSATYSYVANSPLVEQIAFKRAGTPVMTTTKAYDNLNRMILSSLTGLGTSADPGSQE